MTMIHEIENMAFNELKANRSELIEQIVILSARELAERYLQARTDAIQRDEKLAEQGKTITSLNEASELLIGKVAELQVQIVSDGAVIKNFVEEIETERQSRSCQITALHQVHSEEVSALNVQIMELKESLLKETQRAVRLKVQAIANQAALTGAATLLNDAISARHIEDADTGE